MNAPPLPSLDVSSAAFAFFETELSGEACLVVGVILSAIGAYYLFMLCFHPAALRRSNPLRHGDGPEKGPPVSRFTGFAVASFILAFGLTVAAAEYFHAIKRGTVFRILLIFFFAMAAGSISDSLRAHWRRRKRRLSRAPGNP